MDATQTFRGSFRFARSDPRGCGLRRDDRSSANSFFCGLRASVTQILASRSPLFFRRVRPPGGHRVLRPERFGIVMSFPCIKRKRGAAGKYTIVVATIAPVIAPVWPPPFASLTARQGAFSPSASRTSSSDRRGDRKCVCQHRCERNCFGVHISPSNCERLNPRT